MCFPAYLLPSKTTAKGCLPPRPGDRSQRTHYHSRFLLFFFGLSLSQHKLTVKTCFLGTMEPILSLLE
nr:MAG TPA: hypothetical protein [Caudoviricetes sp.]